MKKFFTFAIIFMGKSMKNLETITILLLLTFGPWALSIGQEKNWRIVDSSGDTLITQELRLLGDSMLVCKAAGDRVSLSLDSLAFLILDTESHFAAGAFLGASVGLVGFFITSSEHGSRGNLVPILGGALLGGVMGAAYARHETCDLRRRTQAVKVIIIRSLLSQ